MNGELEKYRQLRRTSLEKFAGGTAYSEPINVARAALLAPGAIQDEPLIRRVLEDADKQESPEFWMQATAALAEYRRGNTLAAIKRLESRVKPLPEFPNTRGLVDALAALAYQKASRPDEARAALARAKAGLAADRARPDRGWLYDHDWHNWVQLEILIREAESVIPAAPVTAAAPAASRAQEENALRDRKARTDRLSTEFALALIRVKVGPKGQAETELRGALGERLKITEEEPTNPDYQADVFAARLELGRFLISSGRNDEGGKELAEAVAIGQKLIAERPTDRRTRRDLATTLGAFGDLAWKTNRPAEAVRALRAAIEMLDAALKEEPKDAELNIQIADAEYWLGAWYSEHGALPEAARAMRVDKWPETADLWRQVRAGQLRLLAGDPSSIQKVAERALAKSGIANAQSTLAAVAVANAMSPELTKNPHRVLELAKKATLGAPASDGRQALVGAWEYRTGQYEEAIRLLDTPALRENAWANAFLAMAYHKLNRPEPAQQWLKQSSDHLKSRFRTQMAVRGASGDPEWETLLDALCLYRQAHEVIVGKTPATDPVERLYRAVGYQRLGEPQKAETEYKAVMEARPDDSEPWLVRARQYAAAGDPELAKADLVRAESLANQALARQPSDADAASTIAEILLDRVEQGGWRELKPSAVKSEGGATLTVQPDRSVLASGLSPDNDEYTVEMEADRPVVGLRLEALSDPSLPQGGAGRYPQSGDFLLSNLAVAANGKPVRLAAHGRRTISRMESPKMPSIRITSRAGTVFRTTTRDRS